MRVVDKTAPCGKPAGVALGEEYTSVISIWNKEELPEKWKESIIVPIYKKDVKQIVVIIGACHFCQLRTKFYATSCCQG